MRRVSAGVFRGFGIRLLRGTLRHPADITESAEARCHREVERRTAVTRAISASVAAETRRADDHRLADFHREAAVDDRRRG